MGISRAIRIIRRTLFGSRNDVEIRRVTAALARHEEKVAAMDAQTDRHDCCTSCKFGAAYSVACDQAERTRGWLIVLLDRRGRPEDQQTIRRLKMDMSP